MKIIADENIPCVEQAFASLGEVILLPGRSMQAADVGDADVLLVRSVTRVDAALLDNSPVRFVGSATIGFDHVDRDYLQGRGIGFSTAPGSNATSAAEYVVSVLMVLSSQQGFELAGKTVGIIGCGNVGSRVRQRLTALGMRCLVNDPPLQAQGVQDDFVPLEAVLQADIVTLHVPLEKAGRYPTFHLVNAARLQQLGPGAIFINTARGAVADNQALDDALEGRDDLTVVLDVWENEPAISTGLLQKVALGTPHIAGYSIDGKLRGTGMIYEAACEYFDMPAQWHARDAVAATPAYRLTGDRQEDVLATLREAVLSVYDVREDDARLRETLALPDTERSAAFDALRKNYPVRREFSESTIQLQHPADAAGVLLGKLGFRIAATD
jgi:erythronate-4-phosphate dehydrogenase